MFTTFPPIIASASALDPFKSTEPLVFFLQTEPVYLYNVQVHALFKVPPPPKKGQENIQASTGNNCYVDMKLSHWRRSIVTKREKGDEPVWMYETESQKPFRCMRVGNRFGPTRKAPVLAYSIAIWLCMMLLSIICFSITRENVALEH